MGVNGVEVSTPMPNKHFYYRGRFAIRTEWEGGTLLYDVFSNTGRIVAAGFDMLSGNEETALEGILSRRLNGKSECRG